MHTEKNYKENFKEDLRPELINSGYLLTLINDLINLSKLEDRNKKEIKELSLTNKEYYEYRNLIIDKIDYLMLNYINLTTINDKHCKESLINIEHMILALFDTESVKEYLCINLEREFKGIDTTKHKSVILEYRNLVKSHDGKRNPLKFCNGFYDLLINEGNVNRHKKSFTTFKSLINYLHREKLAPLEVRHNIESSSIMLDTRLKYNLGVLIE